MGTDATYSAAYTYDTGGNILTATKTMPGASAVTHVYTYDDSRWPDLLTAYDGHSIIYDEIGNPTSYYNGTSYTMSWAQGRRLETIQTGSKTITFAYDMDGIRVSKTVVTDTDTKRTTSQTDYITQSGLVVQQTTVTTVLTKSTDTTTTSTRILEFTYDSQQRPFCVLDSYTKTDGTQSQTRYYYVLNLQGDVVALMTASGSIWATYTYDAWGKPLQVLNGSNTVLSSTSTYFANVNPLRYRGYYYDTELGFYYLQSRYYDPSVGRFINADAAEYSTMAAYGLADTNLFVYCRNNPVVYKDDNGNIAILTTLAIIGVGAVIGAAISAVSSAITQKAITGSINWTSVAVAAGTGFVSGAIAASPLGLTGQVIASGVIGLGSYAADCYFNDTEMSADEAIISMVGGAIAGYIGGSGANTYMTLTNTREMMYNQIMREMRRANQMYAQIKIASAKSYLYNTFAVATWSGSTRFAIGCEVSNIITMGYNAIVSNIRSQNVKLP